ncbi:MULTISPECIES: AbrB/MazE/SpoVT family DNA-binding domain-containing protein [unclassified Sporosarcina]|uniref:AbrB/MazE/SpoVT family DNA-binding domain-containing protein n=1 Tax=unclassified Sporosarcina TaxID=2647733 RepID=UPI00203DE3FA|nr:MULTISPECIES: AbrB/MazE/SpoVT family DNA-binding domain-containing protein [unclassified Sporosarcina]GKV66962.1 hypothetical protein NCCP2331_31150 [Sporosarcina sp. NCCP-2331]GLB57281.1 hypothetical protein NCCP2378_30690 [Sporosarcina sp. NCCP-2378]
MAAMERRITQVGNSLGLTLPAEMLKKLDIKKGDEVKVEMLGDELVIKKVPHLIELPKGIPADFFDILNEEMEAHHEALKGLVNR